MTENTFAAGNNSGRGGECGRQFMAIERETVPVTGEYDIIVCGGGPAGIGAACAAACSGMKTLLAEHLFSLGGITSNALASTACDTPFDFVFRRLMKIMRDGGAMEMRINTPRFHSPGRPSFETESYKGAAAMLLRESGCEIMLGTIAESAWLVDGTVRGLFIADRNGRSLLKCGCLIDCSAEGSIAVSAGAGYMFGDEDDSRIQKVNFKYLLHQVDWDEFHRRRPDDQALRKIFADAVACGELVFPAGFRNGASFPFDAAGRIGFEYWELEGVNPAEPREVSKALLDCQIAATQLLFLCRKKLPGFGNATIIKFPGLLGTRESRRIRGGYVLTGEDVIGAKKFSDGIARASFWIDFHDPPPGMTIPYSLEYIMKNRPTEGDWYEIPLRCIIPEGTRGILTAGRCISCDRRALASLRVQPTCMYIGSSAGIVAAECVRQGIMPDQMDGSAIKHIIEEINSH